MNNVVTLQNFTKQYGEGETALTIFSDAEVVLNKGECVALVAPSGTGKSTLLHALGLLDSQFEGEYALEGQWLKSTSDAARTKLRRESIGFIYQFHHLLPEFTAMENIALPLLLLGQTTSKANHHALNLLEAFGLRDRAHHRPGQLSGGEQQRVSILRAVVKNPALLLADEPTGNLDEATSDKVFKELLTHIREHQMTAFVATHNLELAKKMDRVLTIRDGKVLPYEVF